MKKVLFILVFFGVGVLSFGATIKGKLLDENKEPLIGAHVLITSIQKYAVVGLDGSFTLTGVAPGSYVLEASFVGYKIQQKSISILDESESSILDFFMEPETTQLNEVVVTAKTEGGSDFQARFLERNSANTLNVVSAKSISLTPDLSVANVVQRVSGLSVERNANGDPQYAIVRGMDKRYSYTLINGVKIPSPDNKNRYVPLDIFPAALLDRLEVYKSLTADLEGDAMGGGINLVMKGAPEKYELKGDFQLGYNQINVIKGFDTFNSSVVRSLSPREQFGVGYQAQPSDFTKTNGNTESVNPIPDILASVSIGNRLLQNRLGIMVGGSFQNSYRGTESIWFDTDTDRFGSNLPSIRSVEARHYSTRQIRTALHSRIDYRLSQKHSLNLYTAYYKLINNEARETNTTFLDGRNYSSTGGNSILSYSTRTRVIDQGIFNTTVQGNHKFTNSLTFDWSAVYSVAKNDRPDNLRFDRNGELKNFVEQPINVERRNPRQWERNTDTDYTGYWNFTFKPTSWKNTSVKTGGLYRIRERDNYFNRYFFDPNPSPQIKGVDWKKFSDVRWEILNPAGSATDALNYNASEKITALYALTQFNIGNLDVNTGIRAELTTQGYELKFPNQNQTPDSTQNYNDILPSLSLKYKIASDRNLRFTYYKAISRPGYFEVVPYVIEQDGYDDVGNPALKRAKADNVDLRYEYFPNTSDQILLGVFYKNIKDPIEYAVVREGVNNEPVMKPGNYGTAHNLGVELDFSKFFNKIGIKGNYTFTYSTITSLKSLRTRENPNDPTSDLIVIPTNQTRPLQGQAKHIGNLALLYKDIQKGFESQLSMVYTGERLEVISPFIDNDWYSSPIVQMDFSIEKSINKKFEIFLKGVNLLNSPYEVFVKKPLYQEAGSTNTYPYQEDPTIKTLVRRDRYYQSFRFGVRFNLN